MSLPKHERKQNKLANTLEGIAWFLFALGMLALINIIGTWIIATY